MENRNHNFLVFILVLFIILTNCMGAVRGTRRRVVTNTGNAFEKLSCIFDGCPPKKELYEYQVFLPVGLLLFAFPFVRVVDKLFEMDNARNSSKISNSDDE